MNPTAFSELLTCINLNPIGIASIELDGDDGWNLHPNEGAVIMIDWLPSPSRLFFSTLIGHPPASRRYLVYESLLNFNAFWRDNDGARMGLNGHKGEPMFIYELRVDKDFTVDALDNFLVRFVEIADLWRQYVTGEPDSAALSVMALPVMSSRV